MTISNFFFFLRMFSVRRAVLSTVFSVISFALDHNLPGKHYCPHFRDEKREAQGGVGKGDRTYRDLTPGSSRDSITPTQQV